MTWALSNSTHSRQFRDFSESLVAASLQMPPRWGLDLWESRMLHKCRPAGAEEHIFTAHFIEDPKDVST